MESADHSTVLITGVSVGLGRALADCYLQAGCRVLGLSRRAPDGLTEHDRFRFVATDLQDAAQIKSSVEQLSADVETLDRVILNAGILGAFSDLLESDFADISATMQVNVWANLQVLNALFAGSVTVRQVVAISSGASVNGNRGWGGYSISKAALNMLVMLYSHEQPETHFCALAPGLIDTAMQDTLLARAPDERYPAIEVLRSRRNTSDMPTPHDAAPRIAAAIERLPDLVSSGAYADVRQLDL